MKIDDDLYDTLLGFISERERVRIAKDRGLPKPWTNDPIIQQYRFCNINRNDDTVTKWIANELVIPHANSRTLWFNLMLARFLNVPGAIYDTGYVDDWNSDRSMWVHRLSVRRELGYKNFSSAYMIRAGRGKGAIGLPKHEYLAEYVFQPVWDDRISAPVESNRCSEWGQFFLGQFSFGEFMTNQIITDMKYTRYLEREYTPDWSTFVLAGPGTKRGLYRLCGMRPSTSMNNSKAEALLLDLRDELMRDLPDLGHTWEDLNNVANTMCEYDKYLRAYNGEGRPRQNYPGA